MNTRKKREKKRKEKGKERKREGGALKMHVLYALACYSGVLHGGVQTQQAPKHPRRSQSRAKRFDCCPK